MQLKLVSTVLIALSSVHSYPVGINSVNSVSSEAATTTDSSASSTSTSSVSTNSGNTLFSESAMSNFKQLGDGTKTSTGKVYDFKYQSSGNMWQGCPDGVGIEKCLTLQLKSSGDGTTTSDGRGDRQRDEILTDYSKEGATVNYSWKFMWDAKSDPSNQQGWMHNMQLKSKGSGAVKDPTFSFDCTKGQCMLRNWLTNTKSKALPYSKIAGKLLEGTAQVKFAKDNSGTYNIKINSDGETLFSLEGTGKTMFPNAEETCLKTGLYRQTEGSLNDIVAYIGDITSE